MNDVVLKKFLWGYLVSSFFVDALMVPVSLYSSTRRMALSSPSVVVHVPCVPEPPFWPGHHPLFWRWTSDHLWILGGFEVWSKELIFLGRNSQLDGETSKILCFHPENWGNDPIWRAYFSDGLKPPTRQTLRILQMSFLVSKPTCFEAVGVSLGGPGGVSVGGVRILRENWKLP